MPDPFDGDPPTDVPTPKRGGTRGNDDFHICSNWFRTKYSSHMPNDDDVEYESY